METLHNFCQRYFLPKPVYITSRNQAGNICRVKSIYKDVEYNSGECANYKIGKNIIAEQIYNDIKESTSRSLTDFFGTESVCILIDGDQRVDCWRFVCKSDIPDNIIVFVYTGPTSFSVDSNDVHHIRVPSTSKDAADARILMDLGGFLAINAYHTYYIVSSDHILVQAAIDSPNVNSIINLKEFLRTAEQTSPS